MASARVTSVPEGVPCVLRIVTVKQGTTSTIELEGEWDLGQRDATREAVAQALQRRPECLVLDLSRLSFIDSSGIHALIEAHRRCIEQEIRMVIIPGPRAVQRVFEICGLIELLPFAPEASSVPSRAAPPISRPLTVDPSGHGDRG